MNRYDSITLTVPGRAVAAFDIVSALNLAQGRRPNPPDHLDFDCADASTRLVFDGAGFRGSASLSTEGTFECHARWLDAGLTGQAAIEIDRTGPGVSVQVGAAPSRCDGADGGPDERDPEDFDAGTRSWRRDEVIPMTLVSNAQDLDPSSVRLNVSGFDVPMSDAGVCDGGRYCRVVALEAWRPVFNAYRGSLSASATAADDLRNFATSDAGAVPLTRWWWSWSSPYDTVDSIALDADGGLYASGSLLGGGSSAYQLFSLTPGGYLLWTSDAGVGGALAVGDVVPAIYSANDYSFRVCSPRPGGCMDSTLSVPLSSYASLPVVVSDRSSGVESVFFASANSTTRRLSVTWRSATLGTSGTRATAIDAGGVGLQLLADGPELLVVHVNDNAVSALSANATLTSPIEDGRSPATTGFAGLGPMSLDSSGALVGVGRNQGVRYFRFRFPGPVEDVSAPLADIQPSSSPASRGAPLVGLGAVYFPERLSVDAGIDAGTRSRICRATFDGGTVCTQDDREDIYPFMALGEGRIVYTSATFGSASVFQARDADTLAVLWQKSVFSGAAVNVPISDFKLNCRGKVGVLYGGTWGGNRVLAVIVDSRGLDATADWPLASHDPRNSADVRSSLTPWTCP